MTDEPKGNLEHRVALAVSEALATRIVAKKLGIDKSMAAKWLRFHRDQPGNLKPHNTNSSMKNIEGFQDFALRLIQQRPGIKSGEIAELLVANILSPEPIVKFDNRLPSEPLNANQPKLETRSSSTKFKLQK